MEKYQDVATIIGPPGLIPVRGVSVTVFNSGTSTQPVIFSDNSSTVTANPLTTDASGLYSFYAANGRYDVQVSGAGVQTTLKRDIVLSDLAASSGSSLVGFIQSGTGAVARTLQAKVREVLSVTDFFADGVSGALVDPTGVVDSTGGFNAARAALGSAGGIVYAPAGTYKITAALSTYTANQQFCGDGMRATRLDYSGTGYCFTFGSTSSSSLSYGCGIRDASVIPSTNTGDGIRLAGTSGATVERIYIEGVVTTNASTGVYIDGAVASNLFTKLDTIICNHIKTSYLMSSAGVGQTTSVNAFQCSGFGDLAVGSIGFDVRSSHGNGSTIVGGNLESLVQGIKSNASGLTWVGVRFEGNTTDVRLESAVCVGNTFIGLQGAVTWSDNSLSTSNQRFGNVDAAGALLQNYFGQIFSDGNLILSRAQAGTRYILVGTILGADATSGRILMQAGQGSGTDGGSLVLYGANHAATPNDVAVGLSGTAAFRVVQDGLDTSATAFSTDIQGNTSWKGASYQTGDISPAQLVANTDDWAPTGLSSASIIRLSTDASRNLTGLTGGADGRRITLCNIGAFSLVIVHDATSTAANRFYCPGSANYTLLANSSVDLIYDSTSSRWRVIA